MELVSSNGTTLQGPSSLSSRERVSETTDFVIINGQGNSSSYDEPDFDLFSSLSQADAVAQVKELLQQREMLQSNFAECTQRLSDMTLTCNELKVQEQQNCQRAKDRIDKLVKEKETLQEEIKKLNDDRSPDIKQPAPALHVAIPTSEQISIEENTSERLQDTPVEYCTSAPLTAQGVPATMMSLRETEVEELRAQIQTLKAEKNDVELRLCENEEHSRQVDLKREAAERRCADISTQFRQFRQDNDLQLVNLSSANEELKSKLKQAESEIHRQAAEFDSTQQEILNGLRKKCNELETSYANQVQIYTEAQREWSSKEQALIAECHDWRKRCLEHETYKKSMQEAYRQVQSEKTSAEQLVHTLNAEKYKADSIIAKLKPIITDCGKNIHKLQEENSKLKGQYAELQRTSDGVQQENGELNKKIDHLYARIEELNQSVGDEISISNSRCDEWKEKFKSEKLNSEKVKAELLSLQQANKKFSADVDREKRHVQKLNDIITRLKQENAKLEGNVTRLEREVGELNSHNIQRGRVFTLPISKPTMLPDNLELNSDHMLSQDNQKCPIDGCDKVGDASFLSNHINRDHYGS
ncbi:hypothetical protein EB796_009862 [Bugula neritina]|uniref:Uncharacterized protein n=1 Tax=Bugula neritina TaxID=10212 RepID=A0A7J7K0V1_BUGNE|nr:hypothetical protein EB796_009862 [Bugula neritina]